MAKRRQFVSLARGEASPQLEARGACTSSSRTRAWSVIHGWCLVLVGLMLCVPVRAQEPSLDSVQGAGEHFALGRAAFDRGAFEEASENFERADALAPSADALSNAITARLRADQLARAATLAVLLPERDPTEAMTEAARSLLERARSALIEIVVSCTEPCNALVGRRVVHGGALSQRTVYLDPGDHELYVVFGDEEPQVRQVSGQAGDTLSFEFDPAPAPAPRAPASTANEPRYDDFEATQDDAAPAQSTGGLPRGVFWTALAATGVLGAVSVWSAIDTQNNPGEAAVRNACQGANSDRTRCLELYDDGQAREKRTNLLWAGTGILAVATALVGWTATDWGSSPEDAAKASPRNRASRETGTRHVTPWLGVSARGATLGAVGSF